MKRGEDGKSFVEEDIEGEVIFDNRVSNKPARNLGNPES